MKKTYIPLCLLLALTLTGCGETPEEPVLDPTVTVDIAAAEQGSLRESGRYMGTVSSEGTATVVAQVSGQVDEVTVSAGDEVSAGQLLCRFDDETAQLALSNAKAAYQSVLSGSGTVEAAIQSAQAAYQSAQDSYQSALASYGAAEDGSLTLLESQVKLAEDNYNNTRALCEIGAASELEVTQAEQAMLSAQAGLEAAKASLNAARSSLNQARAGVEQAVSGRGTTEAGIQQAQVGIDSAEYQLTLYNVTAPISGIVEAVNVLENNFTPAGTAAFVISNAENKTVTFYVTDGVRSVLRQGQKVTASHSGKTYTGSITEISGIVSPGTGLFQIKAVVEDAQTLPDGLTVEVATTAYVQEDAVLIPSSAVYFQDGDAYVYLAEDNAAQRRDITVGLYTAETIAVTEGLKTGDPVIISWSSGLKDGAPICLAEQSPAADGETED